MKTLFLILISFPLLFAQSTVQIGADRLIKEYPQLVHNKRVAVVSNAVSLLTNGKHIIDILVNEGITVTAIFSPEHGFSSAVSAGDKVGNSYYKNSNIPVYSLYGEIRKPKPEMLKNVDVIIYDIQDVGVRFYTYISTMVNSMQAAAENNIQFVVLDRPNPLGGELVEGPLLDTTYKSFVGIVKIPAVYGLTCGELAQMVKGEKLFPRLEKLMLTIIPITNYKRSMQFNQLGLQWNAPSPNIPDFQTTVVYPGTCLFEATNLSEGRGTDAPFLTIGAPFVSSAKLMAELSKQNIAGLSFTEKTFTPVSIQGKSTKPKRENQLCNGIRITVTDSKQLHPFEAGIKILHAFWITNKDSMEFRKSSFEKLSGVSWILPMIKEGRSPLEIISKWKQDSEAFKQLSKKYYLYH